jgi:hypothetical protein
MCVVQSIDVFYGFVCHIVKNFGLWHMCVVWSIDVFMDLCARLWRIVGCDTCVVWSIDIFYGFVCHIVKNVDEAPFLQFVFETHNCSSKRSKQQQVFQEVFKKLKCWFQLWDSLSQVVVPNGIIFLQTLDVISCYLEEEEDPTSSFFRNDRKWKSPLELNGSCTNIWGVVVQAQSAHASACYKLKTTKVCSSVGLCT